MQRPYQLPVALACDAAARLTLNDWRGLELYILCKHAYTLRSLLEQPATYYAIASCTGSLKYAHEFHEIAHCQ